MPKTVQPLILQTNAVNKPSVPSILSWEM